MNEKYIIVKLNKGDKGINSCYFSGINLEDIVNLFGPCSNLLTTFNEFRSIMFADYEDFIYFIKDRRKYYDVICADVVESNCISIDAAKSIQLFADINTPTPILWMPDVANEFCIYSHDTSLYTYVCFKTDYHIFCNRLINTIFKVLNICPNMCSESLFDYLVSIFENGVVIDAGSVKKVRHNSIKMKICLFEAGNGFSDMVFPSKKIVGFKDLIMRKTDDSLVSCDNND